MLLKLVEKIDLTEFGPIGDAIRKGVQSAEAQAKRMDVTKQIKNAVDKVDGYTCKVDTDRSVSILADNKDGCLFKINVYYIPSETPGESKYEAIVENWLGKTVGEKQTLKVEDEGGIANVAKELSGIIKNNRIKASSLVSDEPLGEGIKDLFRKAAQHLVKGVGDVASNIEVHKENKDLFKKLSKAIEVALGTEYKCKATDNGKVEGSESPKYVFCINGASTKEPLIIKLGFDYSDGDKEGTLKLNSLVDCLGKSPDTEDLENTSVLTVLQRLGKKLGVSFVLDSNTARSTGSNEEEIASATNTVSTGTLAGINSEIADAVVAALGESLNESLPLQEAVDYNKLQDAYKKANSEERAKIVEYASDKIWNKSWKDIVKEPAAIAIVVKALGDNLNPDVGGTFSFFIDKYLESNPDSKIQGNMADLFIKRPKLFSKDFRDKIVLKAAFWNNTDDKGELANVLLKLDKVKEDTLGKMKDSDESSQLDNIYHIQIIKEDGSPIAKDEFYTKATQDPNDASKLRPLKDLQAIIKLASKDTYSYGNEEDDEILTGGESLSVDDLIEKVKKGNVSDVTTSLKGILGAVSTDKKNAFITALTVALSGLKN